MAECSWSFEMSGVRLPAPVQIYVARLGPE